MLLKFKINDEIHIVNTRCIHMTKIDNSTKGDNIALAPMLDFLNHTSEARVNMADDCICW
jgi:hypothetical protein